MVHGYRFFFHGMYKIHKVYDHMYKITIHIGTCIVSKPNKSTSYWAVLNHYGISNEDLKKLNLSYNELFEIYKTIQKHEQIREFLKHLKEKINITAKE